jgi:pimeloyl-ACP methyl ester carboxylesterase
MKPPGKGEIKHMWTFLLILFAALIIVMAIQYFADIRKAYERLERFHAKAVNTSFGKMSYLDEGSGDAVLLSHGIFGGYDQAFASLKGLMGSDCRKIAPSRFGYPGSDLPYEPTPQNQAKAFAELLDSLHIQKAYVITTSAGGAAGISFALNYPERLKGLILLSSGVPGAKKTREQITGKMGPPAPLLNEFPMWLSIKYFGFVFKAMFASDIDRSFYDTMLPVQPRLNGIRVDEEITNVDMDIRFEDYEVEKTQVPMLVIHAKDDPMAKYESVQRFIDRTHAKSAVFETGGHLITGHANAVSAAIREFMKETRRRDV